MRPKNNNPLAPPEDEQSRCKDVLRQKTKEVQGACCVHGFTESASECKEVGHVYNFEDGELVYHEGREDIDVKQAFSIATGKDYAAEIKREADAMRARLSAKFGSSYGG